MPDLIRRWNERGLGPRIRYATFEDLRDRIAAVPAADVPVVAGDWTDFWSFGAGSTPVATAVNQQTKDLIGAAGAFEGHELAAFAVLDRLERLAGDPVADKGIAGVLVGNTTAHARTVALELPEAWLAARSAVTERTYRASRMS
jgi:alpha-mannosidase